MDSVKTVCIGVPCYGQVAPEVLEDWGRWLYHCGRRLPQYNFFLAIKTKTEQFRARNAIVTAAQQANADYLLMIDDDMILDIDHLQTKNASYDLVDKLIQHGKDICGVLYFQRGGECRPVLMATSGDTAYRFFRDDEVTHGLQEVAVAGGGCLMVDMKVFNRMKEPYFAPEHTFGTDIQLCRAASNAGFSVWADTSIELGHLKSEQSLVTSRTRHLHQMADTVSGEIQQQFIMNDAYASLEEDASSYTGMSIGELQDRTDERNQRGGTYHSHWEDWTGTLLEWYQSFGMDRITRQLWFNSLPEKRKLTSYLMSQVNNQVSLRILDFGCGIGFMAYELAKRGHRVVACDLKGTETLQFLRSRVKKHDVAMTFHESETAIPPLGSATFDLIIAMDCFEHIPTWRAVLSSFADRLSDDGVLFANNAILNDPDHAEHVDCKPADFVGACAHAQLWPRNEIMYVKKVRTAAA